MSLWLPWLTYTCQVLDVWGTHHNGVELCNTLDLVWHIPISNSEYCIWDSELEVGVNAKKDKM